MTSRAAVEGALAVRLGSASEARWIADEVLGRSAPGAHATVDEDVERALWAMADRRLAGEPLQYVLGSWDFRTIELAVDPRALIPRPETEQVVEVALAELERARLERARLDRARLERARLDRARLEDGTDVRPTVADLGTGTGAIALSIAVECLGAEVWATDVDPDALALASANLDLVTSRHPHVAGRVHLVAGSWFDPLPDDLRHRLDLVLSNPPYVSEGEWENLEAEVRSEPRLALVGGPGSDGTPGLGAVEAVLAGARDWVAPGGTCVVEIAPHQADAAASRARGLGWDDVWVAPDLAGRARMVVAHRRQ